MARAHRGGNQHAEHEGSLLLEEEDGPRPLRIDPAAQDAQGVLVEVRDLDVRMGLGCRAPVGGRVVEKLGDLFVGELVGARGELAARFRPLARFGQRQTLQHEATFELEQQDLLEALAIGKGADRTQDVLPVLARAAVVDAHASLRDRAALGPPERRIHPPGRAQADFGCERALAIRAAVRALFTMRPMLVRSVAPPEIAERRRRTNGVTSPPRTFADSAWTSASSIQRSTLARSSASSAGGGCTKRSAAAPGIE